MSTSSSVNSSRAVYCWPASPLDDLLVHQQRGGVDNAVDVLPPALTSVHDPGLAKDAELLGGVIGGDLHLVGERPHARGALAV